MSTLTAQMPPLPQGFTLDAPTPPADSTAKPPPIPDGYTVDAPPKASDGGQSQSDIRTGSAMPPLPPGYTLDAPDAEWRKDWEKQSNQRALLTPPPRVYEIQGHFLQGRQEEPAQMVEGLPTKPGTDIIDADEINKEDYDKALAQRQEWERGAPVMPSRFRMANDFAGWAKAEAGPLASYLASQPGFQKLTPQQQQDTFSQLMEFQTPGFTRQMGSNPEKVKYITGVDFTTGAVGEAGAGASGQFRQGVAYIGRVLNPTLEFLQPGLTQQMGFEPDTSTTQNPTHPTAGLLGRAAGGALPIIGALIIDPLAGTAAGSYQMMGSAASQGEAEGLSNPQIGGLALERGLVGAALGLVPGANAGQGVLRGALNTAIDVGRINVGQAAAESLLRQGMGIKDDGVWDAVSKAALSGEGWAQALMFAGAHAATHLISQGQARTEGLGLARTLFDAVGVPKENQDAAVAAVKAQAKGGPLSPEDMAAIAKQHGAPDTLRVTPPAPQSREVESEARVPQGGNAPSGSPQAPGGTEGQPEGGSPANQAPTARVGVSSAELGAVGGSSDESVQAAVLREQAQQMRETLAKSQSLTAAEKADADKQLADMDAMLAKSQAALAANKGTPTLLPQGEANALGQRQAERVGTQQSGNEGAGGGGGGQGIRPSDQLEAPAKVEAHPAQAAPQEEAHAVGGGVTGPPSHEAAAPGALTTPAGAEPPDFSDIEKARAYGEGLAKSAGIEFRGVQDNEGLTPNTLSFQIPGREGGNFELAPGEDFAKRLAETHAKLAGGRGTIQPAAQEPSHAPTLPQAAAHQHPAPAQAPAHPPEPLRGLQAPAGRSGGQPPPAAGEHAQPAPGRSLQEIRQRAVEGIRAGIKPFAGVTLHDDGLNLHLETPKVGGGMAKIGVHLVDRITPSSTDPTRYLESVVAANGGREFTHAIGRKITLPRDAEEWAKLSAAEQKMIGDSFPIVGHYDPTTDSIQVTHKVASDPTVAGEETFHALAARLREADVDTYQRMIERYANEDEAFAAFDKGEDRGAYFARLRAGEAHVAPIMRARKLSPKQEAEQQLLAAATSEGVLMGDAEFEAFVNDQGGLRPDALDEYTIRGPDGKPLLDAEGNRRLTADGRKLAKLVSEDGFSNATASMGPADAERYQDRVMSEALLTRDQKVQRAAEHYRGSPDFELATAARVLGEPLPELPPEEPAPFAVRKTDEGTSQLRLAGDQETVGPSGRLFGEEPTAKATPIHSREFTEAERGEMQRLRVTPTDMDVAGAFTAYDVTPAYAAGVRDYLAGKPTAATDQLARSEAAEARLGYSDAKEGASPLQRQTAGELAAPGVPQVEGQKDLFAVRRDDQPAPEPPPAKKDEPKPADQSVTARELNAHLTAMRKDVVAVSKAIQARMKGVEEGKQQLSPREANQAVFNTIAPPEDVVAVSRAIQASTRIRAALEQQAAKLEAKQQSADQMRRQLLDLAKSLPRDIQANFLTAVAEARTPGEFRNAVARMDDAVSLYQLRTTWATAQRLMDTVNLSKLDPAHRADAISAISGLNALRKGIFDEPNISHPGETKGGHYEARTSALDAQMGALRQTVEQAAAVRASDAADLLYNGPPEEPPPPDLPPLGQRAWEFTKNAVPALAEMREQHADIGRHYGAETYDMLIQLATVMRRAQNDSMRFFSDSGGPAKGLREQRNKKMEYNWLGLGYHNRAEGLIVDGKEPVGIPNFGLTRAGEVAAKPNVAALAEKWVSKIEPELTRIRQKMGLPVEGWATKDPAFFRLNLTPEKSAPRGLGLFRTGQSMRQTYDQEAFGTGEYITDPEQAVRAILQKHYMMEAFHDLDARVNAAGLYIEPSKVYQREGRDVAMVRGRETPVVERTVSDPDNEGAVMSRFVPADLTKAIEDVFNSARPRSATAFDKAVNFGTRTRLLFGIDIGNDFRRLLGQVGKSVAQSGTSPLSTVPYFGKRIEAIRHMRAAMNTPLGEGLQALVEHLGSDRGEGIYAKMKEEYPTVPSMMLDFGHLMIAGKNRGFDTLSRRVAAQMYVRKMHDGPAQVLEGRLSSGDLTPRQYVQEVGKLLGADGRIRVMRQVNNTIGYSNRVLRAHWINAVQLVDPFIGRQIGVIPDEVANGATLGVDPRAVMNAARRGHWGQLAMMIASGILSGIIGTYLTKQALNHAFTGHWMDENDPGHEHDLGFGHGIYWSNFDPTAERVARIMGMADPSPGQWLPKGGDVARGLGNQFLEIATGHVFTRMALEGLLGIEPYSPKPGEVMKAQPGWWWPLGFGQVLATNLSKGHTVRDSLIKQTFSMIGDTVKIYDPDDNKPDLMSSLTAKARTQGVDAVNASLAESEQAGRLSVDDEKQVRERARFLTDQGYDFAQLPPGQMLQALEAMNREQRNTPLYNPKNDGRMLTYRGLVGERIHPGSDTPPNGMSRTEWEDAQARFKRLP